VVKRFTRETPGITSDLVVKGFGEPLAEEGEAMTRHGWMGSLGGGVFRGKKGLENDPGGGREK